MTQHINNKRILYIDYVKGLGILLVLLGHSIPGEDYFKNWILSFHMPIFFYICGILIRIRLNTHPINIKHHLQNRTHNLIIPYFTFGFILILFYTILDYYSGNHLQNLVHRISNLLYLRGIDSLWFIPVYFFAELVFILTTKKGKEFKYIILILICISLNYVNSPYWMISFIKLISIGFVFVTAGYFHENCYNYLPKSSLLYFFLVLIFFYGSILNGPSLMQNVNNATLFFANGAGTSFAIISLFQQNEKKIIITKRCLLFYGSNTLIMLCTNSLIIEIVRIIDWKLTKNILLNNGYTGHIMFFIIITLIEIPIIKLIGNKFK